jgi:cation/acetate symporter
VLCGGAMVAGTVTGGGNAQAWLAQPAAWTVPAAFAMTVLVSILTKNRVPASVNRVMSRLHVPERPVATER